MHNRNTQHKNQRGNVLFYILIAIGLIAALTVAISNSMRGNPVEIEENRARILATEIIEYSNVYANAVAQLRLRGVPTNSLCFADEAWGLENYIQTGCLDDLARIYHPDGAAVTWSRPPSEAMDDDASPDNLWHIYGNNEINEVGMTCGASACADLLLVVDELLLSVCVQINDLLGVVNPGGVPPVETDIGETRFVGNFASDEIIGDSVPSAPLIGQTAGCFRRASNDEYVFYKVLIAR